MVRQTKSTKAAVVAATPAPAPPAAAVFAPHIDVAGFVSVRDSFHSRLEVLEQLIKSLKNDYMRQSNLLLGLPAPTEEVVTVEASPASPKVVVEVEGKKERKKRVTDPNAPKRPLTPFFLYMQSARPIIANDLGPEAAKGAVQDEGQKRWSNMGPSEKQGWNTLYQHNLKIYNARVHAYKAGVTNAREMHDADVRKYAEDNELDLDSGDVVAAAAELAESPDSPVAEEEEEATEPEPVVEETPVKPKKSRKRKTDDVAELIEKEKAAPITPASASESKKRRRSVKNVEASEEPKKSARKKSKN